MCIRDRCLDCFCCAPALLIADEPTTALDVTIQAQVLALMQELQADIGMAIMLITHDLGVIADMADEVVVMYAGRVVEKGSVDDIFYNPLHPYTRGLLNSIPTLGGHQQKTLPSIHGTVPHPLAFLCLLYTSPSPRDRTRSRMPSSA